MPIAAEQLREIMASLVSRGLCSAQSRVLLVDDGSTDSTWDTIVDLSRNEQNSGLFCGVSLAHNRGHQNALFSGLMEAYRYGCDCAISMDADLQDDPKAMKEMLESYHRGSEVVYGVRSDRSTDTPFKRGTARFFYNLMRKLGTETVENSADYRLLGRQALAALSEYEESNLFLRGIIPQLGFPSSEVYYSRGERVAGKSKYPLKKMVAFAFEGITSFSVAPIRMVSFSGLLFIFASLLMLVWSILNVIRGTAVQGWASLMVSLWFIGGSLMLSIGVVGEYVGKSYIEAKRRPRWHVYKRIGF